MLDGLHAADAARDIDRLGDIRLRAHEAAQLKPAFESFDVDLGGFQRRFIECEYKIENQQWPATTAEITQRA
jgi:hypothetical protein